MILLQQMTWFNQIFQTIAALATGGVIVYMLKMRRFKNLDSANVDEKRAKVKQIESDIDRSLYAEAMKLVDSFRTQLESMNKYNSEIQDDLILERKRNEEAQRKIEHLQRSCAEMEERCREMAIELEQMKIKVEQYERNRRGPS